MSITPTGFTPGAFTRNLAALGLLVAAAGPAAADDAAGRDLTAEQATIYSIQGPVAPAASASAPMRVVAWVDHADNTYAEGEDVRLFVRTSRDAYLTVLNVGPSGTTTLLFPNAFQTNTRVSGGATVEIPPPGSGASIRVAGPALGRELIKIIASDRPLPLADVAQLAAAGPFMVFKNGAAAAARDLAVVMAAEAEPAWDDYNKVITTVPERPLALAPLAAVPSGTAWPTLESDLRLATDKARYRLGEAVSIFISAPEPCYLTLFNIGSSGRVRVLLPNAAQPRNLLPAGTPVVFPGPGSHLELTPIGPAGVETVTAVCTADNRPVIPAALAYGDRGFAELAAGGAAVARDLAVVAETPARDARHATLGFLVTP